MTTKYVQKFPPRKEKENTGCFTKCFKKLLKNNTDLRFMRLYKL